ncbi:uncharacterized protein [Musca autumnalis]|uniref:uncharacterized protein n=1 Tax=Musca autumnalis TaxID=221902 RepID=UPI003CE7A8F9
MGYLQMCTNCFKYDHVSKACTSSNCKICSNKHNTLLHLPSKSKTSSIASNQSPTTRNDAAPVNTAAISSASVEDQKNVILATAKVIIKAANGMSGEFRAVLDSGSQVNLVTERLIKKLSLRTRDASLAIEGVGNTQRKAYHRVNVQMLSNNSEFSTDLEAFVLPTIIPAQPNRDLDISKWQIPQNIKLADPNINTQGKVDILLGAEFYFSLMQPGTIKLSGNQPILQNTALGWIVGGLIEQTSTDVTPAALACAIFDSETSLEQAIEKLLKFEEVEASEKVMSPLEKLCESHYNQHVQTDEYGRFIVRLPFRESPTALGKSHAMAYNRFMSLERRLLQKEDIRSQYIKFMQEYEQLGHMQKIDVGTVSNPKYFIPHHCVLKPDSSTTKLRVVFDASAKTSSGYSLTDLTYTGPTVQSELFSILLRFRLPKFVFTTDIEKMYRQILLHPDDQRYQLIIWREDTSHPITTRTAPYLATKCLQKIADDNMDRYPLGSKMLKENFYMDDGLSGADSLSTALETQKELIAILKQHETEFGWIVSGNPTIRSVASFASWTATSDHIGDQLRRFWELENIPDEKPRTESDIWCEKFYEDTVEGRSDGKYIVRLPFEHNLPPEVFLGASRRTAMGQFIRMEKTLSKSPELALEYNNVLSEYITLDHMEQTTSNEMSENGHYISFCLPHHAVIKPERTTTKVRVVFNASKKTESGYSLNDTLHTGPTLQTELIVILRWRFFNRKLPGHTVKMTPLTGEELLIGKYGLLRYAQISHFPLEYEALITNQPIHPKSNLITLIPSIDENQLMRLNGRLANSDTRFKERHPIILPESSRLCKLLIEDTHEELLHAEHQTIPLVHQDVGSATNDTSLSIVLNFKRCLHLKGKWRPNRKDFALIAYAPPTNVSGAQTGIRAWFAIKKHQNRKGSTTSSRPHKRQVSTSRSSSQEPPKQQHQSRSTKRSTKRETRPHSSTSTNTQSSAKRPRTSVSSKTHIFLPTVLARVLTSSTNSCPGIFGGATKAEDNAKRQQILLHLEPAVVS